MRFASILMIALCATGAWAQPINDIFILSDIDNQTIEIRLWPAEDSHLAGTRADIQIDCPDGTQIQTAAELMAVEGAHHLSVWVDIAPVMPWHPRTPHLYQLQMILHAEDGTPLPPIRERFGMRKFERRDDRFFINNAPFFVRACGGEQGCDCDSLTREEMVRRLQATRRFGFNAERHHSYVPSDLYLEVADEVGVLIQMEIHGHIGADPSGEVFAQSREDWIAMIERGRRHPSTFIFGMGNEIYRNDPGLIECQNLLFDLAKEMDPSVLVLNRSGSNPFNDDFGRFDLIERPIGEYEHTGEFARNAFELYLRGDRRGRSGEFPIVAHEYPLVASYPNPALIPLYDEPPEWLTLTLENLRANGQEHLVDDYVWASERIQAICRREMLEEARKFPELDGYSMLRFVDCGAYVSGVVNDFAEPKNITAEEFLRTNGETVLLCTWNQRVFEYGDTLDAVFEISHHGPEEFSAPECQWWLMNGPSLLASGTLGAVEVGAVDVAEVGRISVEIPALDAPARLTLRTALASPEQAITNEWHLWAFPGEGMDEPTQCQAVIWDPRERMSVYSDAHPATERITDADWAPAAGEERLIITDSWQEAFYSILDDGGRIWMISDKSWPWPEEIGIFGLHITHFLESDQAPVVFPELDELCNNWMTICSNAPSRHGASGTLIAPHPALGDFPHEGFCDLQFWPLVYRAKVLQLDRFPPGVEPIIRAIDNFHRAQSKGYMAELSIGRGRLFISTLNFTQTFDQSPATRHLFGQILWHLTGPDWSPAASMTAEELRTMLDDFAVEIAEREPLTHDMRPARYETRWRWLLSANEIITLNIADAEGADENRLDVHWEFAQTQWFLNAQPGDSLTWDFENDTAGGFTATLAIATPCEGLTLTVSVDGGEEQIVDVGEPAAWNIFNPVILEILNIAPGEHRLTLRVPDDAPEQSGRSAQIRDIELRAQDTPPE